MLKPKVLGPQEYYHPTRAMIGQRQVLHKVWPRSKTALEKEGYLADLNEFSEPSTIPRTLTAASANSGFQKERSRSPSDLRDPLGLQILHNPKNGRKVDIVFVHGLGGTSRLTWSKNKDLELFWPLAFLPSEPDICQGRIMTFGYNGSFFKSNARNSATVLDFAKDLLYDLKYAKDDNREDLEIGSVGIDTSYLRKYTHTKTGPYHLSRPFDGWFDCQRSQ